ncbi:ribosome biogenesis GTPase Der [Mycoplasmopsis hyopharyngis]|uniref:ribosome biogenesis GTPase Der n=1 Tax=Mycoplasmopsis hyopharyngis TaxID=29558 RepID=UPI003872C43A
MKNTIAIIGKPNVGKSTLFNRLVGKRSSIVYDRPGVTRDRLYEIIKWNGKNIKLIDTGGIEVKNVANSFQAEIQIQAKIAIEEADVVIFIVDGNNEPSNDDAFILNLLRKANKQIIVAANKLENISQFNYSWYSLGVDHIFPISALHGNGVGDVLDEAIKYLNFDEDENKNYFQLSIIGRPNAGKSSLLNYLAKEQRSIVSNIPGTTRDSVKSLIKIGDEIFNVIDTAGIMRKSKIEDAVDHYALMRAQSSLEESNLSIIMIDATQEISHFDARIIGYALENNKPIIIAINKWDLVEKETNTMSDYKKMLNKRFQFATWIPIVFISAKSGLRINTLIETIIKVKTNLERDIKPHLLSELITEAQIIQPPKSFNNGILKIYFVRKTESLVPTFIMYVNNKKYLHFSYQRFLENQIRNMFDFTGCPLILIFKNKNDVEE